MRKLLALVILGWTAMACSVAHAQVLFLDPTPIALYYWDTGTSQFLKCPNSSTAHIYASTPQAFALEGFNASLGQWTPQTSCPAGGGAGTVISFTSGNLAPLFTTTVTNNTSTPALAFTLTNDANMTFFGNVSGSTGPPSFIHFVAGANIGLTPSGGNTLTISASGGSSGCTSAGTNTVQISDGGGGCLTSPADYNLSEANTWDFHPVGAFKVTSVTGLNVTNSTSGTFVLANAASGALLSISSAGARTDTVQGLFSETASTGRSTTVAGGDWAIGVPHFQLASLFQIWNPAVDGHVTFDNTGIVTADAFTYHLPRLTGTMALYTGSLAANDCVKVNSTADGFVSAGAGCGAGAISGLTLGYIPLAGSATTLNANSHMNDGVTTPSVITSTEQVTAPSYTTNGSVPGNVVMTAGAGSITALPTNSAGFAAPATGGTSFLYKLPATAVVGLLHAAAPGTVDGVNESAVTSSLVALADLSATGSPSSVTFLRGDYSWAAISACATCVTSAASLASTQIMTGAGSQASQTPSSAATLNGSGQMTAAQLLVSGINDGKAPVDITTGTTATLGGTYKSGYTFNQEATAATAVAYTLPTAAAGLQYCVGNSWNGSAATTGVLTVNASASGQFIIFTDGTLSATGGNVTSAGAAADFACFVGTDSTHWYFKPSSGTWTKH